MFSERTGWDRQKNDLTLAVERLRSSGRPLLDLTRSNPTECAFVYDEKGIQHALAAGEILHYRPEARGIADRLFHFRADPFIVPPLTNPASPIPHRSPAPV